MRSSISTEGWQQIKTAYASGLGLREIARNMNIPQGTVLAKANREGWTAQIQQEKAWLQLRLLELHLLRQPDYKSLCLHASSGPRYERQ